MHVNRVSPTEVFIFPYVVQKYFEVGKNLFGHFRSAVKLDRVLSSHNGSLCPNREKDHCSRTNADQIRGCSVKSFTHRLAFVLGISWTLVSSAFAQNSTTNDTLTAGAFYSACLASDATGSDDGLCNSYFRGLTDALFVMEQMNLSHRLTCIPTQTAVSVEDARRMFNRWMTAHPENAANSAGLIAATAVINSFPCPKAN